MRGTAMLWKILVLVVLLSPAAFADSLVREMEAEIRISRLAKQAAKIASDTAWKAVKKTSLWVEYQAARKAYREAKSEERKKQRQRIYSGSRESVEEILAKVRGANKVVDLKVAWELLEQEVNELAHRFARKIVDREFRRKVGKPVSKETMKKAGKQLYRFQTI